MLDWSLVTGWLPAVLTGIGLVALAGLIILPRRSGWYKRVAVLAGTAAAFIVGLNLFVVKVWRPFPDALPFSVLLWAWLGLTGLLLALALILVPQRSFWVPVSALAGLTALILIAVVQVNRFYGQYPSVGTALGLTRPRLVALASLGWGSGTVAAPADGYLAENWQPPSRLPAHGAVARVRIPGTVSGFRARPAYVYLPPAYTATTPRPLLPVLVLLAGQPGSADSWLVSGQLTKMMDRYASVHNGLAPVVVMADNLGDNFANPLCVDSPHGNAETYLAQDVPAWVRAHLQVAQGREAWAIAGLSSGGTCALQMAVRAPAVYGRFLDISGEYEPLDGSRRQTIDEFFHGDAAAYAAVNPVDIMRHQRFPDTAGRIVVGLDDRVYHPQLKRVLAACEGAGMQMSWLAPPGGHNWQLWTRGLELSLDWLAARTHLARG
jgi:enterochelin esterase-like enzyme